MCNHMYIYIAKYILLYNMSVLCFISVNDQKYIFVFGPHIYPADVCCVVHLVSTVMFLHVLPSLG